MFLPTTSTFVAVIAPILTTSESPAAVVLIGDVPLAVNAASLTALRFCVETWRLPTLTEAVLPKITPFGLTR